MRTTNRNLWIVLALACAYPVELSSSEETRRDGMVNIGGVLYPEEDITEPQYRKKAEQLAERLESLKEVDQQHRDYSSLTTPNLLKVALDSTSNITLDAALTELSSRPEEAKKAIDEVLDEERQYEGAITFLSRLPSVASRFGVDYEVEVTKRILDHPLIRQNDQVFLNEKISQIMRRSLLDHLAVSDEDETGTLDKLIAEGRITKGSEFEAKWRKRLASGEEKQTQTERKNHGTGDGASGTFSEKTIDRKNYKVTEK